MIPKETASGKFTESCIKPLKYFIWCLLFYYFCKKGISFIMTSVMKRVDLNEDTISPFLFS